MCIGCIVMHQFVFAVVMRFIATTAGTMLVVMVVSVVMVMSVVMVVPVVMVMSVVMVVPVVMVMVMYVIVSQPFSVRMSRNMVVVMYVFVSMLLHDSFYSVFLHCIHVLHHAAPFCKGTYCSVFRTAADVFQISDFFSHFNSPFLAPKLRDCGTVISVPCP